MSKIDPTSNNNWSVFQGRTFSSAFQYLQADGVTPVNLSGCTVAGTFGINGVDSEFTCTITDTVNGKVSVTLPATTTATLIPGTYSYEINITSDAGAVVTSILYGRFTVLALGY
jgi:hypothetical protein